MFSLLAAALAATPAEEPSPWVEQSFVIVASEKTFDAALAKAGQISVKSGIAFNMRNTLFDPSQRSSNGGLTHSKEDCETVGGYPCYIPRGRWDSGAYLSIEYSSAIESFTPDLYVVIAASGSPEEVKPSLQRIKKAVPDAYIKSASVYMGCLH